MVQPPKSDEYAEFYAGYIQRVPPVSGFFTLMTAQLLHPDDRTTR